MQQLKVLHDALPKMRIEVRGKKLRRLPVHQLQHQPNRFERYRFVSMPEIDWLPVFERQAFVSMWRDVGARAAAGL